MKSALSFRMEKNKRKKLGNGGYLAALGFPSRGSVIGYLHGRTEISESFEKSSPSREL